MPTGKVDLTATLTEEAQSQIRTSEKVIVDAQREEIYFLRDLANKLNPDFVSKMVLHRGFHSKTDDINRPIENSLMSYEYAWSAGFQQGECDIAVTKDNEIILCHDPNLKRLSLFNDSSSRLITDMTLREVMDIKLKDAQRAPTLEEALRSAIRIGGGSQLVIELKEESFASPVALCQFFDKNPELLAAVSVVMCFHPVLIHEFANLLAELKHRKLTAANSAGWPKTMLLTLMQPWEGWDGMAEIISVKENTEQSFKKLDGWLVSPGTAPLDGVYLQYEDAMMAKEGQDVLRLLCKKYVVGMWMDDNKDPDDQTTIATLVECGVSFVNTNLPRNFSK